MHEPPLAEIHSLYRARKKRASQRANHVAPILRTGKDALALVKLPIAARVVVVIGRSGSLPSGGDAESRGHVSAAILHPSSPFSNACRIWQVCIGNCRAHNHLPCHGECFGVRSCGICRRHRGGRCSRAALFSSRLAAVALAEETSLKSGRVA